MSDRIVKVNELLGQTIGQIIAREIELPTGVLVTVTGVSTSRDLRHARLAVSVMPDDSVEATVQLLNRRSKDLRQIVGQQLSLRVTPQIKFIHDDSLARAESIEQLLDRIRDEQ